jgi:hypothetical protein
MDSCCEDQCVRQRDACHYAVCTLSICVTNITYPSRTSCKQYFDHKVQKSERILGEIHRVYLWLTLNTSKSQAEEAKLEADV